MPRLYLGILATLFLIHGTERARRNQIANRTCKHAFWSPPDTMNRIIHKKVREYQGPPNKDFIVYLDYENGRVQEAYRSVRPYKAPHQTDTRLARSSLYDGRTSARNVKNYKYLSHCVNHELRVPSKRPLQGVCPAFSYDVTIWPVGERVWRCSICTIALVTQQCSGLYICTWGADKSLARPTFPCILFDGENISFDASLVIYINSTNIPPIMIINRIYEQQNLLSL